jgi:hypothetical protein
MSLIRISESDDWIVDYDRERGMYCVSYFEDYHFKDEHWFDCFEEKEVNPEMGLHLYSKGFIRGAVELIEYMRKNHRNGIYPYDMTDILKEFCSQYGELKELNMKNIF